SGTRQAANTTALIQPIWATPGCFKVSATTRTARVECDLAVHASEVPSEVHSRVQGGHLVCVAVEHQGRPLAEFADAPLPCLAPAWVVDVRIDVGIKTILVRGCPFPGRARLVLDEPQAHDGFCTLEAVLPGHLDARR